jgi:hypothetical protein
MSLVAHHRYPSQRSGWKKMRAEHMPCNRNGRDS